MSQSLVNNFFKFTAALDSFLKHWVVVVSTVKTVELKALNSHVHPAHKVQQVKINH